MVPSASFKEKTIDIDTIIWWFFIVLSRYYLYKKHITYQTRNRQNWETFSSTVRLCKWYIHPQFCSYRHLARKIRKIGERQGNVNSETLIQKGLFSRYTGFKINSFVKQILTCKILFGWNILAYLKIESQQINGNCVFPRVVLLGSS